LSGQAKALATLYEQAAALASAGDTASAGLLHDAIGRILREVASVDAEGGADVVDISSRKRWLR
jgi:hypothetical protein